MSKNNHTGRKIAIGSAAAGVAGYLAGILTAPKSGKQTRGDIIDKGAEVKEEAEMQLQALNVELRDLIAKSKKESLALSSKAREEFDEAVVAAKDAQNKAGTILKSVKAGQADDPRLNKAIKQAKQAKKNLGKYLKN